MVGVINPPDWCQNHAMLNKMVVQFGVEKGIPAIFRIHDLFKIVQMPEFYYMDGATKDLSILLLPFFTTGFTEDTEKSTDFLLL